jgi:hypothetical protein
MAMPFEERRINRPCIRSQKYDAEAERIANLAGRLMIAMA